MTTTAAPWAEEAPYWAQEGYKQFGVLELDLATAPGTPLIQCKAWGFDTQEKALLCATVANWVLAKENNRNRNTLLYVDIPRPPFELQLMGKSAPLPVVVSAAVAGSPSKNKKQWVRVDASLLPLGNDDVWLTDMERNFLECSLLETKQEDVRREAEFKKLLRKPMLTHIAAMKTPKRELSSVLKKWATYGLAWVRARAQTTPQRKYPVPSRTGLPGEALWPTVFEPVLQPVLASMIQALQAEVETREETLGVFREHDLVFKFHLPPTLRSIGLDPPAQKALYPSSVTRDMAQEIHQWAAMEEAKARDDDDVDDDDEDADPGAKEDAEEEADDSEDDAELESSADPEEDDDEYAQDDVEDDGEESSSSGASSSEDEEEDDDDDDDSMPGVEPTTPTSKSARTTPAAALSKDEEEEDEEEADMFTD